MRRLRFADKILRVRDEPEPAPSRGPPPLCCVHGAGMSSVVWMDVVRRLAPGRRVIAPDLPGHGQSDRWHDEVSLDGYRDAVGSVCARLEVKRVVLMGHSLGAAVALACAAAWPERVAGLVLLNGAAQLGAADELLALLERSLPRANDFVDRMPDELAELSFSPATPRDLRERWQAVLLSAPRDVVLKDFAACRGVDLRPALKKLRLPTLILGGSDDLLVPPRRLRETAAELPAAELHIIERSAHLTHLEQADRFASLLESFLRGVS